MKNIFSQDRLIIALRISLGLIFLWFGLMKMAGYGTVYALVKSSFPFLAQGNNYFILGLAEAAIGLGMITGIFRKAANIFLVLHLLSTTLIFVINPKIMFQPHFPILTMEGEFVFKNIVLILAGMLTLVYKKK